MQTQGGMLCVCIFRRCEMARRGRPVKGAELVNDLDGSYAACERLRLILQTLAGTLSMPQACQVLGISRSRFQAMRREFLARAPMLLEPRPRGRHPQQPTE